MELWLNYWREILAITAAVIGVVSRRSIWSAIASAWHAMARAIDTIADLTTATIRLEGCEARHRAKDLTIAYQQEEKAALAAENAELRAENTRLRAARSPGPGSGDSSAGSPPGAAKRSRPSKTSPTTP